jgi:hypothetical protein
MIGEWLNGFQDRWLSVKGVITYQGVKDNKVDIREISHDLNREKIKNNNTPLL